MGKAISKLTKRYSKDEVLAIASLFHVIDLPEDNRTGVMKVVNPISWSVIHFDLNEYAGQTVTIRFSADVKRVGVAGTLRWQINNNNYPAIGKQVSNAKADIWHTISGEWTGTLVGSPPSVYLGTWKNDSERTTFYIDNVTLEVTSKT
ncbi:MAG: hypothetical protein LBC82_09745 [Oscillospiraceae bacterium]|jgi:hypothetical protein|nr:hypothetical protein [Oscillospiraceae bacterium]